MKVDQIFYVLIKIHACISIKNARSTETIKNYQIEDDFSREDFDDQDNIILGLENSRESEEPQNSTRFERKKEINSYEQLEDISENSRSTEIQQENKNSKTTQKSEFMENAVSNLQENINVAEDASRIISVIGSLEESVEDPAENLLIRINGKNGTKLFSKNRYSKNEIDYNKILTKVNKKLKKMNKKDPPEGKEESSFMNRIEVNIAVDESEIKKSQTLKIKRKTEKVINPHLGAKKSYFKYKNALKEKEARRKSLKEFTSKKI